MKRPVVTVVSERVPEQLPAGWQHTTVPGELFQEPPADVVLLDLPRERCEALLPTLRNSPAYRFAPVYTRQREEDGATLLSDGPIPGDPERLLPGWRLMTERLAMFNQGRPPERFEERVLAWLWTRPHQSLQPRRDTSAPQMYRYPILSAMAGDEQVNEMVWLRLMTEQGWLQPGKLEDRIRLCVNCHSARLNYVDVCPSCNALEIARQPSLHCFTCGHVAPQEHFLKDGLMMCPNCLTRLRHIGADYDRPLENYRCQSCQNFFVDADVEARCLDCDRHHQPDELRIRELRDYQLTENGRLRCRQGFAEGSHSDHFGRLNLIGLEAFHTMLDW